MRFDTAQAAEQVVWSMRLADWPRSDNRRLINDLANGFPPYTDEEQVQNRITTNVNFLELSNIAHSARRQFYNALINPEPAFTVTVDYGPPWRRREIASKISERLNRIMKRNLNWFELRRSVFASDVLHGIGPSGWTNPDSWCPEVIGIEDVLVPSETLLTLTNLPFFAVYRQYTAEQLWRATHVGTPDPGWNMELVDQAIRWAEDESKTLMGAAWPEFWSPEKMGERIKSDSGLYASDALPTIGCYDLFFWDDSKKRSGFRRRIVLDAWGDPGPGIGGAGGYKTNPKPESVPRESFLKTKNQWLYTSGERVYARHLSEIIHFQFADASCVSPFRYHSVRSLGFLAYAVCHLQNRLRCKFNDSVFEALLQYFRVASPADSERLTQVDLIDKGVIPEGLAFVGANERWQVPSGLAEMAMSLNRQTMADNSVSFIQDFDFASEAKGQETATRTRAKMNTTAALVGAMLAQAYKYEEFRFQEIGRRFCRPNSKDPDVRKFRLGCLSEDDIPEEALNAERWDINPTKIIGSGDKQLQITIAEALMRIRALLPPESQKIVDRLYVSAYTENYELTKALVPETPQVSTSRRLAQMSMGTLLAGLPVQQDPGENYIDIIETWIGDLGVILTGFQKTRTEPTEKELRGIMNVSNHIKSYLKLLAQNKTEAERVRKYGDDLKELDNLIKAHVQRGVTARQKQQQAGNGRGGMDPKDAAKIQATMAMAQAKIQNMRESHANRTVERQISFERKMQQDAQKHQAELGKKRVEHAHNLAARELEMQSAEKINRLKSVRDNDEGT